MTFKAFRFLILLLFSGVATATTLDLTGSHIETFDLGNNVLQAQGTSAVTAVMVDPGHFNKSLRIQGQLHLYASGCLGQPQQIAEDTCQSSKILTKEGQKVTCNTTDLGNCDQGWGLKNQATLILDPNPSVGASSFVGCETGDCDPTCEECI